jgi:hypothetical protein
MNTKEPDPCVHHWLVEEPHDGKRYLYGRCKKCGLERDDFRA